MRDDPITIADTVKAIKAGGWPTTTFIWAERPALVSQTPEKKRSGAMPRPTCRQFKSFNPDAFPGGHTEIWYWKQEFGREALWGAKLLGKSGKMPTAATIRETHIKLGTVAECHALEHIFHMLQAEEWSPNGEAWDLIEASGAGHTSMSVGDVIRLPEGAWHMVDTFGFVELK